MTGTGKPTRRGPVQPFPLRTTTALIDDLSVATRKGKLHHALSAYTHRHVLVTDEVGYVTYGPDAAKVLFHVVYEHERYEYSTHEA